jgi:hypothetical protein
MSKSLGISLYRLRVFWDAMQVQRMAAKSPDLHQEFYTGCPSSSRFPP